MATGKKEFTYAGETFTYSVIDDFDCEDFHDHVGEVVDLLRVDFVDGYKFRLYVELFGLEDGNPTFANPTIHIFPRNHSLSRNKQRTIQHILKTHNLPKIPANFY